MFNDVVAGPGTGAHVTTFAANGVPSGNLVHAETGVATGVTLSTTEVGVTFDTNGSNPASGTDAFDVFNGFVDFSSASGSSLEIAGGDRYTYEFSGLDPSKEYDFVGTAIRGNPSYANRWTLVTIEGADSFLPRHSSGFGIVTDGLLVNQVAFLAGANAEADEGFMTQWVEIDPGADGHFSIVSEHYTGATPGVGSGIADGNKSYGISGIRLTERIANLQVTESVPADGQVVVVSPSVYVTRFDRPIDPATVEASDLTVGGREAVSVTVVGDRVARWTVPSLGEGTQLVSIAEGAIEGLGGDEGDRLSPFTATFTVAGAPQVRNEPASAVLATSARLGGTILSTGGLLPTFRVYWGASDGETNANGWQNVIEFEEGQAVEAGTFTTGVGGLEPDTDYFYRVFAENGAGGRWADSTASFTTGVLRTPSLTVDGVESVGAFSARVAGSVTDAGGEAPTIRIFYGLTDGGSDEGSWGNSLLVGERTDSFAATISGLRPETKYHYRATAENSAGRAWSAGTRSFTTTDSPTLRINEFMASNLGTLSTRTRSSAHVPFSGPNEFPDWIEIQNVTDAPVVLDGMHLTDDPGKPNKWQFPVGTTIEENGFLVVYASSKDITDPARDQTGRLHTNFSLAVRGESVLLTSADGLPIDGLEDYPGQVHDVAYGWTGNALGYLASATPGSANSASTTEFVADTRFSHDRGFYEEPFDVAIATDTVGASIRYTLDGTAPTPTRGTLYEGPIRVNETSTLRAIAYKAGMQPTNVDTQTYLFVDDVIRQTSSSTIASGFPTDWNGQSPDYGMDPDVIGPNDRFSGRYADTIRDDLKAIPTLSIVTDVDGIFGAEGIYSNPGDSSLEVPTSVEFFSADGREEFQVNAGIKIQGGAFRSFGLTTKKSFRLKFKSEYGPSKLKYPVFGKDAAQEFDTLTLRMESNDGWQWGAANGQPQFARDEFGRRVQLAMQQPASHGRYTHLYINGVYWGMYNMVERPDQSFGESYLGADKDDWDGLNSGNAINADDAARRNRALAAWNTLVSLSSSVDRAATESARTAAFMRAQGLNPDGTDDPSQESFVDVENMIDYFLVNWYAGNSDWPHKNYYVGRENSPDSEGFQFFMWDAEWSLFLRSNLNSNRINSPSGVAEPIQNFRASEEFRMQFADRVQQHLVNPGGPLYVNPTNPTYDPARPEDNVPAATYAAISEEFFDGLVAESARWGDQHRGTPYTRDAEWQAEFDHIINDWFPARTQVFLNQLKGADLFPEVAAPTFRLDGESTIGGTVSSGTMLDLISALGEVTEDTVLFTQGQPMRALVPTSGALETGGGPLWYDENFVPSGWISGTNGVGYADGSPGDAYDQFIGIDIRNAWNATESSAYARIEFDLDAGFDSDAFDRMTLRMKYDDGFVAYLNGQEVRRSQAPTNTNWQSNATGSNSDANAITFEDFDTTGYLDLLKPGKNVLALHVLNSGDSSSDMLGLAELVVSKVSATQRAPIYFTTDGTDPRAIGGAIQGTLFTDPLALTGTTQVRARALQGSAWSAMNEATFVVNPAASGDLLISEIHYNPASPTPEELAIDGRLDNDDFEFIELLNRSDTAIDLTGLEFERGIQFAFPSSRLAAGERAVVVRDLDAFQLRYGTDVTVLGEFSDGSLSNGGERLTVVATLADGPTTVLDLTYDDSSLWPQASDGVGASLELVDPTDVPFETISKHYAWQSSLPMGGTPGSAATPRPSVVISRVLAHTDPPLTSSDAIELTNLSDASIDIGGWYLSDSASDLRKFRIPLGTAIAGGTAIVFDESDFNPTPLTPQPGDFALSGANGDDVWLVDPTAGPLRFVADVQFGATFNGQTLGVTPLSGGRLVPLTRSGLGCGSQDGIRRPLVSDGFIETIHYLPAEPTAAALAIDPDLDNNDLEYLVVGGRVDGGSADGTTPGWRIRGGVDFDFPASFENASETWILSFDPAKTENTLRLAAFRAHYGLFGDSPTLIGGYSGSLSNDGELIRLQQPDSPPADDPSVTPYVTVDEVAYDNQGDWPKPEPGDPIVRRASTFFGSEGRNWSLASAFPNESVDGDFDGDGMISINDLELLVDAVRRESQNPDYILSGAPTLTYDEVSYFANRFLQTLYGDANLDGTVDAIDLNRLGLNWQSQACGGWQDGDFNGDEIVDATDLNRIGVHWQQKVTRSEAAWERRQQLTELTTEDGALDEVGRSGEMQSASKPIESADGPLDPPPGSSMRRWSRIRSLHRRVPITEPTSHQTLDEVFASFVDGLSGPYH